MTRGLQLDEDDFQLQKNQRFLLTQNLLTSMDLGTGGSWLFTWSQTGELEQLMIFLSRLLEVMPDDAMEGVIHEFLVNDDWRQAILQTTLTPIENPELYEVLAHLLTIEAAAPQKEELGFNQCALEFQDPLLPSYSI